MKVKTRKSGLQRVRKHGFRARMKTRHGRKCLARRRRKKCAKLTVV